MKKFISSKNILTVSILWFLVAFMVAIMFFSYQENPISIVPVIIISLAIALIIWVLLDTRYVIKNNNLYYRSGPIRGRIDVKKIKTVQYFSGLNIPVNTKPALDTKGYIISYNQFDAIYVSPKLTEKFLAELLKINPRILVTK